MNHRITSYGFRLVCSFATIIFVCYCLYEFSLNEDISQVSFQEFHANEDSIYPSLTVCLTPGFVDDAIAMYGDGISSSTYINFLDGQHWDDRMLHIDYDNVTTNFEDYLLGIGMGTPDYRDNEDNEYEYFLYDHY